MRFEGFLKANNLIRAVALYAAALLILTGCSGRDADETGHVSDSSNEPAATAALPDLPAGAYTQLSVCGDISFDYYLYTPAAGENVPLVITFHGYSENANLPGTRILDTLASAESQAVRPCYVLAPAVEERIYLARSERDMMYSELMSIADALVAQDKVDPARIYIMGNSFGGLGTVEFSEAYPEAVAGAIVMCPALTYDSRSTENLVLMKDVPARFAQATNDNVIPITVSRSAVSTLKALGAVEVDLTEFSDDEMLAAGALVGYHQADFAVMADEDFMEWLFEKTK